MQTAGLNAFEAIIVDNNSTDNTAEVFSHWRAAHTNGSFTYITETNQGASFARNTGAAAAKGQGQLRAAGADPEAGSLRPAGDRRHLLRAPQRAGDLSAV